MRVKIIYLTHHLCGMLYQAFCRKETSPFEKMPPENLQTEVGINISLYENKGITLLEIRLTRVQVNPEGTYVLKNEGQLGERGVEIENIYATIRNASGIRVCRKLGMTEDAILNERGRYRYSLHVPTSDSILIQEYKEGLAEYKQSSVK